MALPTSGAISFSDIQTFFGGSNPISLSEYNKGGSYVVTPTTYGSASEGLGSVVTSGSGSTPHTLYQYGGVCPSLDTEANTDIGTGSTSAQSMSNYYSGYRIVNPTAGSISGSYTGTQRFWFSGAPYAYAGFYGGNYAQITGYLGTSNVSSYCQLITVQSNPYSNVAGTVTCTFTLSHAGIYSVYASVTGNAGSGHYFSLSGTGASVKTHAGSSASGNISLGASLPTSFHSMYELTHTNTSSTLTLTCGGTGGATFVQIRNNTNYLRSINTSNTTVYNDMLTAS